MGSTKVEFVRDLAAASVPLRYLDLKAEVLARAQRGHYHDFEITIATPKMALDRDLREMGLIDLADKVRNGDYDEEWPGGKSTSRLLDHE